MTWQPITTAPKDGTFILAGYFLWDASLNEGRNDFVFTPQFFYEVAFFITDRPRGKKGSWYNSSTNDELEEHPTHWMPLPEPPVAETP